MDSLQGPADALRNLLVGASFTPQLSLGFLFLVFLLRAVLRKTWLAAAGAILFAAVLSSGGSNTSAFAVGLAAFIAATQVLALLHFGVLPTSIAGFLAGILSRVTITSDFTAWYAGPGTSLLVLVLALAAWAFYTALGGRGLWKTDILER